jgi:hypothetical protein
MRDASFNRSGKPSGKRPVWHALRADSFALCSGRIFLMRDDATEDPDGARKCAKCVRMLGGTEAISSAAAMLGKRGGSVKSEAKAAAARANGKRGGRPRKKKEA